ncbi:Sec61beta family-domain-containing protein [Phyllosticta capitalensis]
MLPPTQPQLQAVTQISLSQSHLPSRSPPLLLARIFNHHSTTRPKHQANHPIFFLNNSPRRAPPPLSTRRPRPARRPLVPRRPSPPAAPATAIRRKAAADRADKAANARPSSTRAAGAGGSSSTMLRLYTDESPGLKVDPVVVMVLSVGFIISVVALHVIAKITRKFSS